MKKYPDENEDDELSEYSDLLDPLTKDTDDEIDTLAKEHNINW